MRASLVDSMLGVSVGSIEGDTEGIYFHVNIYVILTLQLCNGRLR